MSCEHLICASCAGPVVEGRCPSCRAARAEVHSHMPFGLTPQAIVILLTLAVIAAVLAAHARW